MAKKNWDPPEFKAGSFSRWRNSPAMQSSLFSNDLSHVIDSSATEEDQESLACAGREADRERGPNPKPTPEVLDSLALNFVTFTKLDEHLDLKARRYIRSQVQRNYHAKKRLSSKEGLSAAKLTRPAVLSQAPSSSLATYPSPVSYLAAGRIDPFSSLPIDLLGADRQLFNRFHQFAFDVDRSGHLPGIRTVTDTYIPMAIKDPILINVVLMVGARCLQHSIPQNKRFGLLRLVYEGKLIAVINEALTDKERAVSDSVIAGLHELTAQAYFESNENEYHLHAKALHHLVELRGGLKALGMNGFLAETLVGADVGAASLFGSEPYYFQKKPPKPVVSVGSLNSGFLPQPILSNLSEELTGMLDEICAMLSATNNMQEICNRDKVEDCLRRLMIVVGQRQKVGVLLELPDMNLCTGLAAQMFFFFIAAQLPVQAYAAPYFSTDLYESISRLLELHVQGLLGLLFWATFMGSLAVDARESAAEWLQLIASIARTLRIRTWEEARSILKTFLWLDPRSEEFGKATWLSAQALKIR